MAGIDDVPTPPELAGSAYESAVRSQAVLLKQKLINQTINDVNSFMKVVQVQRASQPVQDPRGTQYPITDQEYHRYIDKVRDDYYEWVVPAFERYLTPDPDASNAMIDALNAIQNNFGGTADGTGKVMPASPGLRHIADTHDDMTWWEGAFQEDFVDRFLSPLQTVVENERIVAEAARDLLLLNKINYIRYRRSVLNLLDTSTKAVDHLTGTKKPKPYMWGTLIVAAIGTALSAGSGAVLYAGTALNVVSTLAGGLTPDVRENDKFDLAAPTAQEVAANIAVAMSRLDADIDHGDSLVTRALGDAYDNIARWRSSHIASNTSGPLNVARPKLDTASPGQVVSPAFRPSAWRPAAETRRPQVR